VISSNNSSIVEFAGNAALYIDPTKPEDIAAQMKKIYKDEQLRNQLIEEARTKSKLHNWDNTARLLWQLIQQVHSQ
jgi:alpha-1,3-rhamnosyl/mannosyltransferase